MIRLLWVLVVLLPAGMVDAAPQEFAGTWLGTIDAGAVKLRLGMELIASPTGEVSVTFISVDQGGVRIPSASPQLANNELNAPLPMIGGAFRGKFNEAGDSLAGTWEQGGLKLPLNLNRVDRLPAQQRPQEPKPPFPYVSEEVTFLNPAAGHALAGTLTLPATPGPHPAIVLVTGSGPQDRDETILGHKPFAVLADAITRRGVAVLRYDDRGVGKSKGDFASATSLDFASDALAGVRYLAARDDIAADRIGLGGHSEGAMIGPMVAAQHPQEIHFLALLAAPAITGEETIVTQGLALELRMGMPATEALAQAELRRRAIRAALDCETDDEFNAQLAAAVEDRLASVPEGARRAEARETYLAAFRAYRSPWFRHFLAFDPTGPLNKLECPVIALLGENDLQVLPDKNLPPLRTALEGAPTRDVRIEVLPGLNHLLQPSETGLPAEYGAIDVTIAPAALELIVDWVAERTKPTR